MTRPAIVDTSRLSARRGSRTTPKGRIADPAALAEVRALLGDGDEVLKTLNAMASPRVTARGQEVRVEGEGPELDTVFSLLESMVSAVRKGHTLTGPDAEYLLRMALGGEVPVVEHLLDKTVLVTEKGRRIRPRTLGQLRYVEAIERHGLATWARKEHVGVEEAYQTLMTGLAVRYFNAVAGAL